MSKDFDFEQVRKILDSLTDEQIEKYFPKIDESEIKYGWISIEDELPMCLALDFIKQGYTQIKVKNERGDEFITQVTDHNIWYYEMKDLNVTHWYREKDEKE